ncbi:MAG: carboxypeptidase regulatory-like domain-containing protein [Planctomycetota bacterium]
MQNRAVLVLVLVVAAAVLIGILGFGGDVGAPQLPGAPGVDASDAAGIATASASESDGAAAPAGANLEREDVAAAGLAASTGVRGIVVDGKTGQPLGGIRVVAVKDQPSLAPLVDRFRGMFQQGMFVDTRAERRELARTVSNPDGSFELLGVKPGRVWLDGVSDGWFVRTPAAARVAKGQIVEGIELRASPGGRLRGIVLGADGGPVAGADVSVRPGLNAFLGQITDRQYRWLNTVADKNGRFDIPGVPAGQGYTVSASGESIALEEVHGVAVATGQVTTLTVQGHRGALVAGTVYGVDGEPFAGASVAMIYLDISRVLFSADGRTEPLVTDEQGRFRIEHVGSGRVAFVAAGEGLAPSNIVDLAVVDDGIYDDLELQLGDGAAVAGRVVDDQDNPVVGAVVAVRPFERPNDPQFLKMMLKIRRVETTTDADGRFVAKGLTGDRLRIEASKAGYTTAIVSGVELTDPDIVVRVQRGVTIRGRVVLGSDDPQPVTRFRIETRTREVPKDKEGNVIAIAIGASEPRGQRRRGGPPWRRNRGKRTRQLPEGMRSEDRSMGGSWRELQSDDGTFELTGIPPGRVRLRLRADGFLPPENQTFDFEPGSVNEDIVFVCGAGVPVSGRVVDASGAPVSDAQVTAYKKKGEGESERGRGPFNFKIDQEDFDFLALSTNQRAALTRSDGSFTVPALASGEYRFTARHPDMAKASATKVMIAENTPPPLVEIVIDAGGAVEGSVTGLGMRPLADALMVAFSLQAGSMRSGTTDARGYYRIDGLPPGQYAVVKSRLDERADNIGLELMSNMRLKTVTVRRGKTARLDVHDEGEEGVRVFGTVRENGEPVPRALITLLGSDRQGLLGMGVRANAADLEGRYQLVGIAPGDYVMQVTRFQGQPVQTTFEITVPDEVREYAFDISLPTSELSGRVLDSSGNPVAGIGVSLGSDESGLSGAGGLVGMIAQNGLSRARTDDNGEFTMKSVAAGTYRLTAGARAAGRERRSRRRGGEDEPRYGEASLDGVFVDGVRNVGDLVVTVPLAGSIAGTVLDGSGAPVSGAEIVFDRTDQKKRRRGGGNPLLDLFGSQQPIRTGEDGAFAIEGLTPGTYAIRVESDALEAGKADDVVVYEGAATDVQLQVVQGATLRVRAVNVAKESIPFGNFSLLDGKGKPVVSRVSTLSVMKRLMGRRDEVEDSGWYTFGSVPPDTYTLILREKGQPEVRLTRTIRDGETVEWDIDVGAELAARGSAAGQGAGGK